MKKKNFNLFNSAMFKKMVLPILLLVGLVITSATSVKAQSASDFSDYVGRHISTLPGEALYPIPGSTKPDLYTNAVYADKAKASAEARLGNLILLQISNLGKDSEKSIEDSFNLLSTRIPAAYLVPAKAFYVELLQSI